MARVEISSMPWGVLQDRHGESQNGATATLKNLNGTNATTWSAVTGGSSSTASLTADSNGNLPRFVEGGQYTLDVPSLGVSGRRVEAVSGSVESGSVPSDEMAGVADGDQAHYDTTVSPAKWRVSRPTLLDLATYLTAGGDVMAAYTRALARLSAKGGTIVFSPRPDGAAWDTLGGTLTPRSALRLLGHGARGASELKSSVGVTALIGQPSADMTGFAVEGMTFSGAMSDPTLNSVTVEGRSVPMPRRSTRTGAGNGATSALQLTGDLNPVGTNPVITDVALRNNHYRHMEGLPFFLSGVRGVLETQGQHSYNTLDFGWTFNEHIVSGGNSSRLSGDNGFSYSRGNQRISLGHHEIYCCAYGGLWLAGFLSDAGPQDFIAGPIIVKVAGHYGVDMHLGPQGGDVWVYVSDVWRGLTEEIAASSAFVDNVGVGVVVTGLPDLTDPATTSAEEITIRGKIRYAQRGGALIRGAKNIGIDLEVIDTGTQFLADGTTAVTSLADATGTFNQRNQNFGVAVDQNVPATVDRLRIKRLVVRDGRASPRTIYPLVIQSTVTNAKVEAVIAEGTSKTAYAGVAQNTGGSNILGTDEAGQRVDTGLIASGSFGSVGSVSEAVNAVQTLTPSGVTGGTFTVTFNGQTTGAITWNASGATLQTALQALTSIGAGNATVTGGGGAAWVVTFTGTLANQPQNLMSVNGASLTGSTPTITPSSTVAGGPVNAYFRDAAVTFAKGKFSAAPQVMLSIDGGSTGSWIEKSALSATGFTARLQSLRPSIPAANVVWRAVGT